VKHEDNKNKFSTGSIFKQRDMLLNSCTEVMLLTIWKIFSQAMAIVDKKTFEPKEITFANIWGVCDEDMYHKAIKIMNQGSKKQVNRFSITS
jgi:hypothetical protein